MFDVLYNNVTTFSRVFASGRVLISSLSYAWLMLLARVITVALVFPTLNGNAQIPCCRKLLTFISALLIKWRVHFRDLNFYYFRLKFSIHSRKKKALFYQGGDPPRTLFAFRIFTLSVRIC